MRQGSDCCKKAAPYWLTPMLRSTPSTQPTIAAEYAEQEGFRQKQRTDLPPFEAESLECGDLFGAPPDHHQHGVDDADAANQQRAQPHHHNEAPQQIGDFLIGLKQVGDNRVNRHRGMIS